MGLQPVRIGLAPVGEIHHLRRLGRRPRSLRGLDDVEPIAVEEERVFPEQAVELPNHRVVVWNGLALKLSQSSFDLCGREFHRTLLLRSSLCRLNSPPQPMRQGTTRGDSHLLVVKRGGRSFIPRAHRQLSNADADGWLLRNMRLFHAAFASLIVKLT
jgi:hypothetical protein